MFANQICSKWNKNLYKVSRKMCGNENSSKLDGKEIKLWPCATQHGLLRPIVVLHCLFIVFYSILMVFCGLLMAFSWCYMAKQVLISLDFLFSRSQTAKAQPRPSENKHLRQIVLAPSFKYVVYRISTRLKMPSQILYVYLELPLSHSQFP